MKRRGLLLSLGMVGGLLGVWQAAGLLVGRGEGSLFAGPTDVVRGAWEVMRTGELLHHARVSMSRLVAGFLLASAVGVPLGLLMGTSARAESLLDATLEMLRPIPPIAWIPLAIIWFGVGDQAGIFLVFLGAFFPMLVNTIAGVKRVDRNLVRAARTFGVRQAQLVREVILPGALPLILTGSRIGLGLGWVVIIAAELAGAQAGLGYSIQWNREQLRVDLILVYMATIGLIGAAMDLCLRRAQARLLPWWGLERR